MHDLVFDVLGFVGRCLLGLVRLLIALADIPFFDLFGEPLAKGVKRLATPFDRLFRCGEWNPDRQLESAAADRTLGGIEAPADSPYKRLPIDKQPNGPLSTPPARYQTISLEFVTRAQDKARPIRNANTDVH